ncbi:hypothetical protein TBLA_0B06960 [Henningerozyma blattae CBS 6284]|uniref:SAM-dependent MTase RsmB/NOP-type domain-containing protein n=1 Tax=Henningerozyma blattae (strain ATCC 34711 / CBS 6284 / DSM 70876 / NBRC 10599 / NRRL Y-10934 / UCD 77-7) TaxID=1071380 RepID=I2GZG5_HENB6|nr:hypothetical protein TBLA_0B06960 [Tetrapisispora blattae CBS 6284]CCH59517.1 hypothetical protein TBLA_0B06960 [Tetrapisispora blattae CBS 6284]
MNFYRDATWVLEHLEAQDKKGRVSGSLLSLVVKSCKQFKIQSNPKHVYAVVESAWKFKPFIERIMAKSGILDDIPKKKGKPIYQRLTLLLLIHDLMFSKSRRIQMGKHPIKTFVLGYKTRLHSELVKLKLKLKVTNLNDMINANSNSNDSTDDITPVRWIRINPIRIPKQKSSDDIILELRKKFTTKVDHWSKIKPGCIYYDEYIPNLFGISPTDKITSHELYKNGKIIIQDRASCFPAHILNATPDDYIIDACAAPGNKTTHVASYIMSLNNDTHINFDKKRVFAFEKDPERSKILDKMVKIAGCKKLVEINTGDFTKIATPEKYPNVTGFIVDPSCSGSGIFGRKFIDNINSNKKLTEKVKDEGEDDEQDIPLEQETLAEAKAKDDLETRLSKLSSFQFQVVKHAMSFPSAKKIVYSTCSIHAEENERVVIDLLLDKKVKEWGWKVTPRSLSIPTWERRGLVSEFEDVFKNDPAMDPKQLAEGCIRTLPKEDGGIGFFAVCFERNI